MAQFTKKQRLALGLLFLMIPSCSALQTRPTKPPVDFDPAYLNQQIRLVVVRNLSAFNTTNNVAVLL